MKIGNKINGIMNSIYNVYTEEISLTTFHAAGYRVTPPNLLLRRGRGSHDPEPGEGCVYIRYGERESVWGGGMEKKRRIQVRVSTCILVYILAYRMFMYVKSHIDNHKLLSICNEASITISIISTILQMYTPLLAGSGWRPLRCRCTSFPVQGRQPLPLPIVGLDHSVKEFIIV